FAQAEAETAVVDRVCGGLWVRSGCGWRVLPIHFGPWQTVYSWFRELARRFLFQTIHDVELMLDHERQGRDPSRSAVVIVGNLTPADASGCAGARRQYAAAFANAGDASNLLVSEYWGDHENGQMRK